MVRLVSLLSLNTIVVLGLIVTPGCLKDQQSDPVAALESLRSAIIREDWDSARQFFSDDMQRANSEAIGLEQFYRLDYWRRTKTVHNLFASPLILTKDAKFGIVEQTDELAIVSISYPDVREKDVRLQRISLRRDQSGHWKVAEIFGQTSGIQ
jgi:hypothetical protein